MSNYLQRICRERGLFVAFTAKQIKPLSAKILSCSCGPSPRYLTLQVTPKRKGLLLEVAPPPFSARTFATPDKKEIEEPEKKLSLLQRFKQMYRDYWYVLLPVHVATSAVWVAGFYYLAKSGVDVVSLLEGFGASEKVLGLVRDSSTGYVAITYALYKIATPARYTVTLGGTTIAINYLKEWGYIKPIPPKEKLKEMYQERRDNLKDNLKERKDSFFKSYRKKD